VTITGQNFYTIILRDITTRKQIEAEKEQLFAQVHQQREQLRQLAQQVLEAEEEERGRLSRELHDEAGQSLTALQFSLASIAFNLPQDADDLEQKMIVVRQKLQNAIILCEATAHQIRLIAHNLHPFSMDKVGLNLTLEGFCDDFAEQTGLSIEYSGIDVLSLGRTTDITIYRFLQEALTNIARHAQANQVWVTLHADDSEASISVEDDGQGFDTQLSCRQGNHRGIGLLGIQERLKRLQGWLEIDSTPGKGTLVIAHIPQLPAGESEHESN
jgi:signal transduction histidine kinase